MIIHKIVLANEKPRGAWRILAESGFCGGNAEQTALRADHIFGSETLFENLRRVRDSNPRDLAAYTLSKRAHSTTMRTLRINQTMVTLSMAENLLAYYSLIQNSRFQLISSLSTQ